MKLKLIRPAGTIEQALPVRAVARLAFKKAKLRTDRGEYLAAELYDDEGNLKERYSR